MTATVPEAVQGNQGLHLLIDSEEYSGNVKSHRITNEDKDDADLTFLEAQEGETKDYSLALTFLQAMAANALWRKLWDNPGGEWPVVYGPYGNAIPSASKPHFTFTVKANGRPEVGVEASRSKTRADAEYTLEITSPIVLDDGV